MDLVATDGQSKGGWPFSGGFRPAGRDIQAARAIFKRRGRALELQPRSVADKSMSCPSCGKVGIRLVAFTDAAGVLHMIGTALMPYDSS